MNREILLVVQSLSNERGLPQSVILEAIEAGLASIAAKRYREPGVLTEVEIDPKTGAYKTFRLRKVVETMPDESALSAEDGVTLAQFIDIETAKALDADAVCGEYLKEPIENAEFGRIAAQQARYVITQKVREAERRKIIEHYQDKVGEIFIGVVKRVLRHVGVILDMGGGAEALLPKENMLPREAFRLNDRVRVCLSATREEQKGAQLLADRTSPEFLIELFKIEVPEVGEGIIEVRSAARDPGSRAKIAVKTNDGRIDPVGACVGMRGARVQAVSNELAGERIDIILWDDNPAQLIVNAMAPATVESIMVDEQKHAIDVVVAEQNLAQAIGRAGQNVRLASELSGWRLNVLTAERAEEKHTEEVSSLIRLFVDHLGVDEELAAILVQEGFSSIEDVAFVAPEEMASIEGFDRAIVETLQSRASEFLLLREIEAVSTEALEDPAMCSVRKLAFVRPEWAERLCASGIVSREALAELSVEELLEKVSDMGRAEASKVIMEARAYWFE